ncbi:hypothetical protein J7337_006176 [Fusarium musae]|uniref:Uncharacterized protein n=1 Tax=Fusarium musae TaxID=1042133 RepID=A0A9P8IQ91_9HYPO|nr:hypothetical protein J7337_006176 [Fusarium musae]KAG9503331.1 hypothetical protein J7337_006176 [Fusarium musae]
MLRPTDSPMPIGVGFLLLSFGAKFASAVPYQIYQLNERDINTDTTTTDTFVSTTTSAVAPIDVFPTTSSDVVVINTETSTNNDAVVVDTTTGAPPVIDTPTAIGQIVGTTSAEIAPVGTETSAIVDVLSSTDAPVVNPIPTTTEDQTTSNWIPPAGTETDVVGTPGASTDVPPPVGTETATTNNAVESIGTTTNTDLPPVGTETTSDVPAPVADTTTNSAAPLGTETTSSAIDPVDTTTDLPAPGPETTTTQAQVPVDTTTSTAIPPPNTDTSAEAPPPETTTDNVEPPSTTASVNNIPSTTEKASEPSDKPSDAPSAPVTAPPQEATAAASQAQVTASEYNSKVDDIIPIIVAWTNNPDGLKTDTLNKVNNLIDGVKGAIKDLGGNESGGCPGKRRRGLLDIVSNVINTLSCVVSNLEDVTGKITGGIVEGVTPIVSTLTNNSNDLKDQSEEEDDDDDQSKTEKQESKTEEEESKTEETKTEASTTEKPTSTEAETTTSAETTETTGSCKMRETTSIPAAWDTQPKTSIALPPTSGDGATGSDTSAGVSETGTSAVPTSTEAADVTTSKQGPESTTVPETSVQETSTKPIDETSTADQTAKTEETTRADETDTSAPTTTTPSTFITTTRPSDQTTNTITSEDITTAPGRTYYPCGIYGGPRVTSAYCQCSTTVSGKQYIATATLIDNKCEAYTEYPSKVDPATEAPPPTQAPINEPLTKTIDGTVLAWTAYTLAYGQVYKDVTATFSNGIGEVKTITTPVPTQTHVDNDGSGQCGTSDGLSKSGLGDACDRAIGEFDDDTIYTGYTTRYSRSKKGLLMVMSMGQAACIAKFSCDDYGIGMSGKLIKEARENAKNNDNIWMCGHIELSNSCKVVMDYCTNCNNEG